MLPDEDAEYLAIVRQELHDRAAALASTLAGADLDADVVFRHMHAIAGIARDVDPALAIAARAACDLIRTPQGGRLAMTPESVAALHGVISDVVGRIGRLAAAIQP